MLCFDKQTNQFFIASDEQVKIVENQMNDILKRMISEGREIITLSDVMDALGVDESCNQNDDDQNHEQKGENEMEKLNNFVRDLGEILDSKRFIALDRMGYFPEGDEVWESYRSKAEAYEEALRAMDSLLTQYKES